MGSSIFGKLLSKVRGFNDIPGFIISPETHMKYNTETYVIYKEWSNKIKVEHHLQSNNKLFLSMAA